MFQHDMPQLHGSQFNFMLLCVVVSTPVANLRMLWGIFRSTAHLAKYLLPMSTLFCIVAIWAIVLDSYVCSSTMTID